MSDNSGSDNSFAKYLQIAREDYAAYLAKQVKVENISESSSASTVLNPFNGEDEIEDEIDWHRLGLTPASPPNVPENGSPMYTRYTPTPYSPTSPPIQSKGGDESDESGNKSERHGLKNKFREINIQRKGNRFRYKNV